MESNKYLTLARQARAEGNTEDAKNYYNKVREENPENGEAKFFYAYYALYEGTNGEIPQRYGNLCKVLPTAIELVKNSGAELEAQLETISQIANTFIPEAWSLNRYMNKKNRETKVGDSYVKVFESSAIVSCITKGMFGIRDLGDQIEKLYPENEAAKALSVAAWKEYVTLAQKWYAYPPKGEAETYAEKIKKIDPSYEMPKKAGCISFSDKRD